MRDVIRPDLHAALDEERRIAQEAMRDAHVGLVAGQKDRVSTEIHVGPGMKGELPEVLGMADRVVVIREGRLTANLDRAKATAETVMYAATHAEEVAK